MIEHYKLSITQIFPLGLCRMIAFELVGKRAKVESTLTYLGITII